LKQQTFTVFFYSWPSVIDHSKSKTLVFLLVDHVEQACTNYGNR